jgi:aspartate dehydrogenase
LNEVGRDFGIREYRIGYRASAGGCGMTLSVAVGGFGAIGKAVARRLDQGIEGLALAVVSARDVERAEAAMAGFAHRVPVLPLARLWEHADIVVE